ncbi:protein MpGID1L5 [Marchantia polymorpha subsp. ruderalis]|nr:hypothetical protein MARPO_0013s0116 [Marchantia polymorpha]BBN18945.1 hypothetical protein Mp_8g06760 [Marchantia polymorpha subsp. ruderalis]PTQ45900.1 hypothetical protein MARPO_0013s0116 [Marchantia polymorpha]PTQ45901.1 hypothetical protein MARPO_0013s0116 [Marchantia polymorpha]BBN18946.1 hypothetical protein Mp_8g06760 [Marchantia polymorpha subsp. ruderalis]|eukprot:PTQ45899.1 hypothetical protein MARPO_0013s0116 [Marchantia polymorpha]
MDAAEDATSDYEHLEHFELFEEFFDAASGLPKFDLTFVHHGLQDVVLHSDFSLQRPSLPLVMANSNFVNGVATKDVTLDDEHNLRVRLFIPEIARSCKAKLPLFVYFHGGGFSFLSVDCQLIHDFCEDLCKDLEVIVASCGYRMAPEHPLPGQFEDALASLEWLLSHSKRSTKDNDAALVDSELDSAAAQAPELERTVDEEEEDVESTSEAWLTSHADFDRVFLVGDSAGGNLVHNILTIFSPHPSYPLHFAGLILIQPAFGGMGRTPAESGELDRPRTCMIDFFWKVCLPRGADRSHPFCHVVPTLLSQGRQFSLPDTLVVVGGRDLLRDWQLAYYEAVKRTDTNIKLVKYDQAEHGFYTVRDHDLRPKLMAEVAEFVTDKRAPLRDRLSLSPPHVIDAPS